MDSMPRPGDGRGPDPGVRGRSSAFAGLILIVFGGLLLIERLTGEPMYLIGRMWGLAPIIIGLAHVTDPVGEPRSRRGRRRSGLWLMYVGLWGLANEFHAFGLTYANSWPLLVIGVGLMIVWGALDGGRRATQEP
jgi:LiaF transmembrane domain